MRRLPTPTARVAVIPGPWILLAVLLAGCGNDGPAVPSMTELRTRTDAQLIRAIEPGAHPLTLEYIERVLHERGVGALPAMQRALPASRGERARILLSLVRPWTGQLTEADRTAILACLRNGRPAVRREAAYVLGHVSPDDARITPALFAALHDVEHETRSAVIYALLDRGELPALVTLLEDETTPTPTRLGLAGTLTMQAVRVQDPPLDPRAFLGQMEALRSRTDASELAADLDRLWIPMLQREVAGRER